MYLSRGIEKGRSGSSGAQSAAGESDCGRSARDSVLPAISPRSARFQRRERLTATTIRAVTVNATAARQDSINRTCHGLIAPMIEDAGARDVGGLRWTARRSGRREQEARPH